MKLQKSIFDIQKHVHDDLLHTGFSYRGRTIIKSIDNNLLKIGMIKQFCIHVEKNINLWFDETRKIKLFRQIALDKNDTSINL